MECLNYFLYLYSILSESGKTQENSNETVETNKNKK